MKLSRFAALGGAAALAVMAFSAVPAFAASSCGTGDGQTTCGSSFTATASVQQFVSLTGVTDMTLTGSGVPGTSETGQEVYTFNTNDPLGAHTEIQVNGTNPAFLTADGLHGIPDTGFLSFCTVRTAGLAAGPNVLGGIDCAAAPNTSTWSTTTPQAFDGTNAPGSATNTDSWTLNIPSDAAPGTYTESFTYIIAAV